MQLGCPVEILEIFGKLNGDKMNIPLFKVFMPEAIDKEMLNVLHSGYVAEGEYVREFERLLKAYLKNEYIVATNSCTSALHLSLALAGVKPGDTVLTTPMTCIATNVPVANIGAIPIWIDVDPIHGMVTRDTLHTALMTARQAGHNPGVVIYVCWGGDLGPLPEVAEYCEQQGLQLIVDAAQALGVTYTDPSGFDRTLGDGTHGNFTCFSFQAIKHITTGDGGVLALKGPKNFKRAFDKKWFGIDRDGFRLPNGEIDWNADVPEIGFKFHMNNIAGCIGKAQLSDSRFEDRMHAYIENDKYLTQQLERPGVFERAWKGATSAWVSTFSSLYREEVERDLLSEGIHVSQMHSNIDIYSGFQGINVVPRPGVAEFMQKHLCLPCGWWVTAQDNAKIVKCVKESLYEVPDES